MKHKLKHVYRMPEADKFDAIGAENGLTGGPAGNSICPIWLDFATFMMPNFDGYGVPASGRTKTLLQQSFHSFFHG